jgi:hypothetical protein
VSTVVPPVRQPLLRFSQATRVMLFDCSPACVTQPPTTCSISAGIDAGALDHGVLHLAEQRSGVERRQIADAGLAACDRGADGFDDHGFAHGGSPGLGKAGPE